MCRERKHGLNLPGVPVQLGRQCRYPKSGRAPPGLGLAKAVERASRGSEPRAETRGQGPEGRDGPQRQGRRRPCALSYTLSPERLSDNPARLGCFLMKHPDAPCHHIQESHLFSPEDTVLTRPRPASNTTHPATPQALWAHAPPGELHLLAALFTQPGCPQCTHPSCESTGHLVPSSKKPSGTSSLSHRGRVPPVFPAPRTFLPHHVADAPAVCQAWL